MTRDRSLNDVLEEERGGQLMSAVGQNPLPEDNDPPAAPATSADHPSMDTGRDTSEVYEEGEEGVAYTPTAARLEEDGTDEDDVSHNGFSHAESI